MTPHEDSSQSTSTALEYTRVKLLFGALLAVLLVFIIGYIVSGSFSKIIFSLNELSTPRKETSIVQGLITDLSEIQHYAGAYGITGKSSDLEGYINKRKEVHLLIDSLSQRIGEQDYYKKVDSLHIVYTQYISSLNEWLVLKSANPKDIMSQVYETIQEGDSSLMDVKRNVPRSRITRITTTVENPITTNKVVEEEKENKSKNFFRRIFSGSRNTKKEEEQPEKKKEAIRREVITETMVQPDTVYYQKVDTLLGKMKQSLTNAEEVKTKYAKRLNRRAMVLLENNLVLVTKVNQLVKSIAREEQLVAQQKVSESRTTAGEAYVKLIVLSLIGGIFLLLLVYFIFMDISKSLYYKRMLQKTSQEAQKLAKVKEEFLANMSHEIRTPLNTIIGYVEQLKKEHQLSTVRRSLKVLESSSQHLLYLVNDILDYSKLESGALRIEHIGFCLEDLMGELYDVLHPEAKRKGLELRFFNEGGSEQVLLGDPVRLKQILINLIGNGLKFTHAGTVCLSYSVRQVHTAHYLVKCCVTDTGIGIAQDKLDFIFQEFSQADTSITRNYGGTGLGLSISKKLVTLQGGKITVQSELSKGTTFTVEIPFKEATINDYKTRHRTDFTVGLELKGKRIVIVDDDVMVETLLSPLLSSWHLVPRFYNEAEEAWKGLLQHPCDLLLLDVQMPGIDGWELLRRIKSEAGGVMNEMRIVFCTANVLLEEMEARRLSAVDGVLYKPFKQVELWDTLIRLTTASSQSTDETKTPESSDITYSLRGFMQFANGDSRTLATFIRTFIDCGKEDLLKLTEALARHRYTEVGEWAHKLQHICGQLEVTDVLTLLKKMEQRATTDPVGQEELLYLSSELQEKCNQLFRQLEEELILTKRSLTF